MPPSILIRNAELPDGSRADVRLADGLIRELGDLAAVPSERIVDAGGGALLPGLHDHHLHLFSLAAARSSLVCGPPEVRTAAELAAALTERAKTASGWIRGVGYHEQVAGVLDRRWLDRHVGDVPVRIQHRSGRLWVLNSAGLETLSAAAARRGVTVPELAGGSGRLYDADRALRAALGDEPPDLLEVSRELAECGVTGVTDMTPENDPGTFDHLVSAQQAGALRQRLLLAGGAALSASAAAPYAAVGPTKVHLHESALPPFDALCRTVRDSHERGRPVAFHCVTETELVFTLAAFAEAGHVHGDRIEHASVAPDALIEQIRAMELIVVSQPNFVAERGDAYLAEIPEAEHGNLYRARSFLDAGVGLAGGTDAPFGRPDPWLAMRAAVARQTANGAVLGMAEALSPEQALALFCGHPQQPALPRTLVRGALADLVLLDRPWRRARLRLSRELVRLTVLGGGVTFERPGNPV